MALRRLNRFIAYRMNLEIGRIPKISLMRAGDDLDQENE